MKIIKRNPIYPDINPAEYNTNNLYAYDPYTIVNDQIIIDTCWWDSLTEYIQELIKSRLGDNGFIINNIMIKTNETIDTNKQLNHIYQAYLDGFDYNIWYDSNVYRHPDGVKMIEITSTDKLLLINQDIKSLVNLCQKIKDVMEPNIKYFVRLSGTSGKNEVSPKPFNSSTDIIKHLTKVHTFVTREYKRDKPTYIILIPWNDIISYKNEFRIFVVDNQLTSASPQRWWELNQHTQEELESIETSLFNLDIVNDFKAPYNTFVADVYIDFNTNICYLIELNPFGAHCGAGSSLFNWEKDYDQLYGNTDHIELRYLSIINY